MATAHNIYAVQYTYVPGLADERDVHRSAHRDFLAGLGSTMVAAGAYVDQPSAALLLMRADTEAAVRAALQADPFNRHGLIESTTVHEWTCAVGEQAAVIRGAAA